MGEKLGWLNTQANNSAIMIGATRLSRPEQLIQGQCWIRQELDLCPLDTWLGFHRPGKSRFKENKKEFKMLDWNEKFETGHSLIDSQHRMLISYVNRLEELSGSRNPSKDEVELFFHFTDFLEDYITTHFREEEGCMLRFRCAAHKDNLVAHAEFLDFFRGFKLRLKIEGYSLEVVQELYAACVAWIQRHVLRIDVQLRPCQTPFYGADESATGVQGDSDAITFLEHAASPAGPRPRME